MGSAHADYLSLEDLIKNNNIIEFNKLLNEEYKTTDLSEEIQYNYLKLLNGHYNDFSSLIINTIKNAEKINHELLPLLYILYADSFYQINNDDYLYYLKKAKNYYLEENNYYKLINVYFKLAQFYYDNKNYHLSLSYLNQIQFLPEKITTKLIDFNMLFLYGKNHLVLFSYEEANLFFEKAYDIYINNKTLIKDEKVIDLIYFLVNNKINTKKFNEANSYLEKIKKFKLTDKWLFNFSLLEIKILYETKLFNKAILLINKMENLELTNKNKIDLLIFKFYILYNSNFNDTSINMLISELSLLEPEKDNKDYNYIMYLYHKKKGNFELALTFFENYQKIYSDFFEFNFKHNTNELRKSLENEVKESNLKSTLKESKTNRILFEKNMQIKKQQNLIITCFLIISIVFIIILVRNIFIKKKLKKYTEIDDLTKIYNRRFLSKIAHELHNQKNDYSLIIFDLDNFKNINDTYGHQFGDDVLIKVTEESRKILRNNDYFGRYGGEEFVVFLPNTNIEDTIEIADRIRIAISNIDFIYDNKKVNVTASFGVNSFDPELNVNEVFEIADKRLYKSKDNGKNIISYED
tara:strand:- start:15387 stop:17126 length:1740 start_codon:yes stop_codon:yes gene_type:complete